MDILIEHIKNFINNCYENSPSDFIDEIANVTGEIYRGEAKEIYAEMVDKVFSVTSITDPNGAVHYLIKVK